MFGILAAYLSNALISSLGDHSWRWMLAVAAAPSLVYALSCLAIPESPRWLIAKKRDRAAGMAVLKLIAPETTPAELEAKADEIAAHADQPKLASGFWTKKLQLPIVLAFLIAFFNQLSGSMRCFISRRAFSK